MRSRGVYGYTARKRGRRYRRRSNTTVKRVRRTSWKRWEGVTTDGDDGGGWKLSFQHTSVQ